jgi:hypothetical protein
VSKKEIGGTLQVAQKLVNHLPKEMDDNLKRLLQRAEDEQDPAAEMEIADLLLTNENIRLWMREQVDQYDEQRGITLEYHTLPGAQGSVPARWKWICPTTDCVESWPVIQEGEDAPLCDVHGCRMIRGSQVKG